MELIVLGNNCPSRNLNSKITYFREAILLRWIRSGIDMHCILIPLSVFRFVVLCIRIISQKSKKIGGMKESGWAHKLVSMPHMTHTHLYD